MSTSSSRTGQTPSQLTHRLAVRPTHITQVVFDDGTYSIDAYAASEEESVNRFKCLDKDDVFGIRNLPQVPVDVEAHYFDIDGVRHYTGSHPDADLDMLTNAGMDHWGLDNFPPTPDDETSSDPNADAGDFEYEDLQNDDEDTGFYDLVLGALYQSPLRNGQK